MIKHIVMWKVRGDTPQEKAKVSRFVKSRFEELIGPIPGADQTRSRAGQQRRRLCL